NVTGVQTCALPIYLEKHSNLETKHLFISGFINFLFTYLIGLSYMAIILNIYLNNQMNFVQILMTGLIPFIPGDLIKLAVAVLLAKQIYLLFNIDSPLLNNEG